MPSLDDLVGALRELEEGPEETKATSVRLPEPVHRAVSIATELGMAPSFTAATTEALLDHVRTFVRRRALAEHVAAFPQDVPPLAEVVARRVSGTDHPAADGPGTIAAVADRYERRHPDWAVSGRVDEAVERVLEHVEVLVDLAVVPSGPASG